ncbi:MAG: iron-sulfur cluster assembly protein [Trueperaceae bacterium]
MSSGQEALTSEAAVTTESQAAGASSDPRLEALRQEVLTALKVVHDPEIPVNIVDLGLVYDVAVKESGHVDITMTLTTMGCPVQDMIQTDAELAAMKVDGIDSAAVEFVWSPPWSLAKMTDDGKKQMRMFGFNV